MLHAIQAVNRKTKVSTTLTFADVSRFSLTFR